MLKILHARLQQYVNRELPNVQVGFRKGRGTRDQMANISWIIKKAGEFQKNVYFCFIDYAKAFHCVDHNKLRKILKEMGISDHLACLLRNRMQVKKQPVELDMEQQTGSKLGKLSSGHRTGKDQFSFQSERKAMPKNPQTTTQRHSSHVSKVMLKILQARFQQ